MLCGRREQPNERVKVGSLSEMRLLTWKAITSGGESEDE